MTRKMLIIDSKLDEIAFLPQFLAQYGYNVTMAATSEEGLALAGRQLPDVVMLSITMPDIDGVEVCRRLRTLPQTADIPILLTTSHYDSRIHAEGLLAGAVDILTKPLHMADLLERLKRAMDKRGTYEITRLLEETAYSALNILECKLAWLLTVNDALTQISHGAIAIDGGERDRQEFLSQIDYQYPQRRFGMNRGDNPLAEVVHSHQPNINLTMAQVQAMPGGNAFQAAFSQIGCQAISLLPLAIFGRPVGVMVLAAASTTLMSGPRVEQILRALASQAAAAVDNTHLMIELADRENAMKSEQAFRQMVLDSMTDSLVVIDKDTRMTYVNNRLCLVTGYQRVELYGQRIEILFPQDRREMVRTSLTKTRGTTLSFAQDILTRMGKTVPMLMSHVLTQQGDNNHAVVVLTDMTEVNRREHTLEIQAARLKALNKATHAITSALTQDEVIDIILNTALETVNGVHATLFLCDPIHNDDLVSVACKGEGNTQGIRIRQGEGVAGQVVSDGQAKLIYDLKRQKSFQANYLTQCGIPAHTIIAAPLLVNEEIIGAVEVINKQEGVFDRYDLEILESLAATAGIAIENAGLFEQTQRRLTEVSTLLDASAAVSSTLDFGSILQRIAQRLINALHLEHVIITSWERDASHFMSLAQVADAYWLPINGPVHPLSAWPSKQSVLNTGKPTALTLEDMTSQHPEYKQMQEHGWRSMLHVPMVIDGKISGLVTVCTEKSDVRFHVKHVKLVEQIIEGWREHVLATSDAAWYEQENLDTLAQQIRKTAYANWIEIGAWSPAENAIHLLRQSGHLLWTEDSGRMWRLNDYKSMAYTVRNSEPSTMSTEALKEDPAELDFMQQIGGKTLLLVPLFIRGKPAGVLKLVRSGFDLHFDASDVSLCQGIANVVGNAIENSQLYSSLEQRAAALEAAYTELKKIDQLKDDLLQNISHELRTPLTHILGYVNLMQDEAFGPTTAEQQDTLNILMRKTQHLADLIKDMVAVQATPDNLNLRALQLDRVVAMAVRNMAPKAAEANIRIDMSIPPNLPLIAGDVVRLSEAIEALIDNAIKFSPGSNHIEITAQDSSGPVVQLSVKDFGIGIPAVEHDKIFQRFYQVDSSTTRRFGGTGLGLALVKSVVTAHSGHIWLESEPDKGSTFHIDLPKAKNLNGH